MKCLPNTGICGKIEQIKNYNGHIARLQEIGAKFKPTEPTAQNRLFAFHRRRQTAVRSMLLSYNPRIEQRLTKIQRENMLLLTNLIKIDLGPPRDIPKEPSRHRRCSTPKPGTSLNRGRRLKDFSRINNENQLILQRLSSVSATYSSQQWKREYRRNQKLARNVSQTRDANRRLRYSLLSASNTRPVTAASPFNRPCTSATRSSWCAYEADGNRGERTWVGNASRRPHSVRTRRRRKEADDFSYFPASPSGL